MSRKMINKRVCFSPDVNEKPPPAFHYKHNRRRVAGIWTFRLARSSGFLRRVGAKFLRALRLVSARRCSSCKVSSSSNTLARSRSNAAYAIDLQRAEAVEDCIEFLNNSSSSSSLRSNSISASSTC